MRRCPEGSDPGATLGRVTIFAPPLDDVAALARVVGAAEVAGGATADDLAQAEALLARLRDAFRATPPEGRADLARLVTPLRERRDALAREAPPGDAGGAVPPPILDVLGALGVEDLRPGQAPAILAAMAGRDALVVMATGSGKSLCYQAPALAMGGLTVVVSPLIALIADQHDRLRRAGMPVRMLTSLQGAEEQREALAAIRDGEARLVLCAPERLGQGAFLDAVARRRVDLLAVDEAHCLAEWGHDFRPEYLRIAALRDRIGARATMALTATATPRVAREVAGRLGLRDPVSVRTGFDRPNLAFDVIALAGDGAVARKWANLERGLREDAGIPAIVYCGTRKEVEEVAAGLTARGIPAAAYHAGMGARDRTRAQDAFMAGDVAVIAATNAFGMGVDKADVRGVWHWSIPTSLEAYYQEAGRAGRDGAPARAVLLAMRADLGRLIHFINRDRPAPGDVQRLVTRLAADAGEDGAFAVDRDRLAEAERLCLSLAERVGAITLAPGRGGQVSRWDGYHAITGYAAADGGCRRAAILSHFADARRGAPLGRCCDVCDPLPGLVVGVTAGRAREAARAPAPADEAVDWDLFEVLRAWRKDRADGKPAYTVCPDRTLRAIAAERPGGRTALAAIHGVGPAFIERHADSLLELIGSA